MNKTLHQSLNRMLLLVAVPLGYLALSGCSPAGPEVSQPPRPAIVVQPQASGTQIKVYPGEVRSRHEPALAFRVGGKINRRLVEVGDRVVRDQPLAELNGEDLQLQLDSARAQFSAAEAEQRLASSEVERYRALHKRQLVSASQFDIVTTRLDASTAQLNQARAALDTAQNQAGYATLKAPQDGVISQRMAEAGQVVSAGQPVFKLAVKGDREVRIDLPEQDIQRFAVGQRLTLELWSKPGEAFSGQIRELSPSADSTSRTYEARVAFNNAEVGAELGQSARAYAEGTERRGALSLPMSAITAEGDQPHVWVLDTEALTLSKAPVTIASYGNERALILSGLKPDSWVAAAGTQLLREGMRVRPVDSSNRPIELSESFTQQP